MVKFVAAEDFDATVADGMGVADFMTDHCGPCKIVDMALSEITFDNPEVNVAKCDIEKSPAYVDRFEVEGTPTLLFIMDGQVKGRMSGAQSRETLEEQISAAMYD